MSKQAPEIFQRPISDYPDPEAAIAQISLDYASRGWNAAVVVADEFVRVVAVPQQGVEPKTYLLGLLKHGYIEDALPGLQAMYGMVDDLTSASISASPCRSLAVSKNHWRR